MVARERTHVERPGATKRTSGSGVAGIGYALILTAFIGGAVLLVNLLWPPLAWAYVVTALALGIPGAVSPVLRRRRARAARFPG